MATDSDLTVTKCHQCGGAVPGKLERPVVRVQVNGVGGVFPTATLKAGDTVEIAFRKNGGTWAALPRQYEIKNSATPPNTLVLYATFKLDEVNFGGQEG